MEPRVETVHSQPSWIIENDDVRIALTVTGGHMAPVTFFRASASPIQPYHVSPWHSEGIRGLEPVLGPLRGDFFCLPFGGQSVVKGVTYPTHGAPATAPWKAVGIEQGSGRTRATFTLSPTAPRGTVTKTLTLVQGHTAVYIQHLLEGFDARVPLGHHATLAGGDVADALLISSSPVRFGMVAPRPAVAFETDGEYSALRPGAVFRSLEKVPTVWKDMPFDSCASFPRRKGFCDIIQLVNKPSNGPAWVAAVNPAGGWLWYALKDPSILPSTVFWMESRGRHGSPWNGRNCCIGLEDVCTCFAGGLPASTKPNELTRQGVATSVRLSPAKPLAVNYIQGVARIPKGFGRVREAQFGNGTATFIAENGKKVNAAVDTDFLRTGEVGSAG